MASRSAAVYARRIVCAQAKLTKAIRGYAQAQVKQWRRVPWLALEADGRGGYSEDYRNAYVYGLWPIEHGRGGDTLFVDCLTGKIVRNVGEPAEGWEIIKYCGDLLDTGAIIAQLEKEAETGDSGDMTKGELDRRAAWRRKTAKELGLKPKYAPKKRTPIAWSFSD